MDNKKILVLIIILAIIVVLPFVIHNGKGEDEGYFGGSDDSASEIIETSGFQPWFSSIWEPPSAEIESLVFAVQAAIGALIIGFIFGYWRGQSKKD